MTDPSHPGDIADTAMFRAFVNEPEPAARRISTALIVTIAAVLVVIVALVLWLILR